MLASETALSSPATVKIATRTAETKRRARDRLVSYEQRASRVMCGHVNWRVIDEQITWRSIRQRMLGTSVYHARQQVRDGERQRRRGGVGKKNCNLSRTRRYTRESSAASCSSSSCAASVDFLARSLAPTGISPTTFRRRGCTPRFGEDLVINHDAAISQSNVRSLAGARGGKKGYSAYTVVCEERREAVAEKEEEEDDEKKGGRVAIS